MPIDDANTVVFHAGTKLDGDQLKTNGGRVLCVTVIADSLKVAQQMAYKAVAKIQFKGMQYRTDIASKGIKYLSKKAQQEAH